MKYKTKYEFIKNSKGALTSSIKNKWIDEICSHMIYTEKHESGYWTKERCIEESLKYESRKELRENSISLYSAMVRNGWFDIVSEQLPGQKPKGYWTKEKCHEEALKYDTRIKFENGSISACLKARKKGWIDEICSHMNLIGNRYFRCIYAIEFTDNNAYIGLTYDIQKRFKAHINSKVTNKSAVIKHINETGLTPKLIQLTDYIDVKTASELEGKKLEEYILNGWQILNRTKCGAVGGANLLWTKDKCIEEASKYKTITQYRKNSHNSYYTAKSYGWLDDVCIILENDVTNKWTLEKCIEEALKYKTRKDFVKFGKGAYSHCVKNKLLNELYSNIPDIDNFLKK